MEDARRSLNDGIDEGYDATVVSAVHWSDAQDRPRILLADDNADMRDYLRRLLGGLYVVDAVPDSEEALRAIRRHPRDWC
ncbi:MAG: hypothetical protein U0835_03095 [Isosphaeraceae bacterium]